MNLDIRSGAKKVSKLGRKSYLTKNCLNLPKLGNFFDEGLFEKIDQSLSKF